MRVVTRLFLLIVAITCLAAAPSMAQTERGYLTGLGGFAASPENTSGNIAGEVGVRIAPHLLAFGSVGRFHDVEPSEAQAAVDNSTALTASQGLVVTGQPEVPASYFQGGLRYEVATRRNISPYVLGAFGSAHLSPTAQFTFSAGTLPDGSTPAPGDDVTNELVTAGVFTPPPSTNAFMFTYGGGVDMPVARHWAVDVGYRASRMSTDAPFTVHGGTFGFGYRF
jgi:opacity protein-like surface antigen